jgi:hypothetical protein
VVSRSRKTRRRSQLAAFQEELKEWIGAEVRMWYFSCSFNRLVLRLARGEAGSREFKFLRFLDCGQITMCNLDRLVDVEIADLRGKRWRLEATGISIDFYSCSLQSLSEASLQEMAGLAIPIMLDDKYRVV